MGCAEFCGRQRGPAAISLRVVAFVNFLTGLGFIIYGIVLVSPPKTALPIGLVIVGTFAMIVALAGLIGSFCWRCCLSLYLVLGAVLTLAQLGIILSLFFNLSGTVDNIANYELSQNPSWDNYDGLTTALEVGRYFFLVALILQAVGMIIAVYLRIRHPPVYDEYKEFENDAERQLARSVRNAEALHELSTSVKVRQDSGGSRTSPGQPGMTTPPPVSVRIARPTPTSLYGKSGARSLDRKMSSKYGEFSHDQNIKPSFFDRMFKK